MKRLSFLCVLVPALALAQPAKTPDDYYKDGETQYNLGNFAGAVEAFKKGYELEPNESKKAAYLFNVAQSYRQAKDCGQSVFFYKRYIALKENDAKKPLSAQKRTEIEGWIREGEACVKTQDSLRQKQPDGTTKPDGENPATAPTKPVPDPTTVATVDDPSTSDPDSVTKSTTVGRPRVFSARVLGGAAAIGAGNIDVPVQAAFGVILGYPLALSDQLVLDLGAGFTFTPVPYKVDADEMTATMSTVFANVAATYFVTPRIGVRADLGVGALVFSNVSYSSFTGGQETSGALTMPAVRVGASVDFAITPNFIATVAPITFQYSPAKEGLREDVDAITALEFMAGLGYRM